MTGGWCTYSTVQLAKNKTANDDMATLVIVALTMIVSLTNNQADCSREKCTLLTMAHNNIQIPAGSGTVVVLRTFPVYNHNSLHRPTYCTVFRRICLLLIFKNYCIKRINAQRVDCIYSGD